LLSSTDHSPVLQVFNKDGSLHKNYADIGSFETDNKGSIYITFGVSDKHKYSGFEKINVESGKVECSVETKIFPNYIRYNKEKGTVYVMDNNGVTRYNASDGKNEKNIFTFGKDSTYVLDSLQVRDFFVGSEEDLYIALFYFESDKNISLYYGYEPKEGTRPERTVTLTVTAPYRQDFLSDAITRYEMKYPDQKVKYDYKYNSEEEFVANTEQYGQQLSLSILGGDVGDVVMTGGSGLNYEEVFKTDAFMDLSSLIEKDKNYDVLNKDVIEGLRIKGAVRGLPISITRSYYEVNTKLLNSMGVKLDYNNLSWKDVISLTKVIEEKAPDAHVFTGNEYVGDYLIPMIGANMSQLVDFENKKINLNQEWFVDLLKDLKEAMKSKNFVKTHTGSDVIDKLQGSLFVHRSTERKYYRDMVYNYLHYKEEGKESLYIPIFVGEKSNKRGVQVNNMYSVNNKSKNKEDAWKFLSFLLEDDIQKLRTLRAEPVNTKANKKILEAAAEEFSKTYGDDALKVVDMMMNIFDRIDYVDMYYNKQDIYDPLMSYINDEMSLEDALKKAEENVWIRLNE
jgi:multiple sugar transport system substrate-binding protein